MLIDCQRQMHERVSNIGNKARSLKQCGVCGFWIQLGQVVLVVTELAERDLTEGLFA